MNIRYQSLILLFLLSLSLPTFAQPSIPNNHPAIIQKTVSVDFDVPDGDFIHKEHLSISVDHPHVQIISWQTDIDAITKYDPVFKENKKVFSSPFSLNVVLTHPSDINDAYLHISYYQHSIQAMQEKLAQIVLSQDDAQNETKVTQAIDSANAQVYQKATHTSSGKQKNEPTSISCYVQNLVQKTSNVWLRLLLVLLLGLLMSLTPCIYPMIPITVGILQSQGSSSMTRNFLLASCYTLGIATMFALLGLLAASTGQMFGAIMANPIVILCIVVLLAYLAFSMLGFYEMYVPRFMVGNSNQVKNGSPFSVFLFGFISGSVASPCLSPGLILLLTIVTTMKSKLLGFMLLFSFGIGLSLPLLIVGTFSSALNTLPQAGMWMVEVKKLFGIMLIGMCFYFLNMIMPWYMLVLLITICTLLAGLFYLYHAQKSSGFVRRMNSLFGMILIAITIILCAESYKAFMLRDQCPVSNDIWVTEYGCAREKAIALNRPLLMKVGGPCCSMCTAIDNKQFTNNRVRSTLKQSFVPIKINGALINDDVAYIKQHYTIHGFPTILIIDPRSETVIKRWESDLYDVDPEEFAQELKNISAAF